MMLLEEKNLKLRGKCRSNHIILLLKKRKYKSLSHIFEKMTFRQGSDLIPE